MTTTKATKEEIDGFNKGLDNLFKGLKPMTKEQRHQMMRDNFERGSREEPDNLLLDDELTGSDK